MHLESIARRRSTCPVYAVTVAMCWVCDAENPASLVTDPLTCAVYRPALIDDSIGMFAVGEIVDPHQTCKKTGHIVDAVAGIQWDMY